ncbi:MAG: hypothetical protein GWM98_20780, partial [Nitrospinaceae bacterium]|nr:hypothetical protein [Nitrospinaceae bacterium]NIR56459.1 hypothetical protein [Nitrospinaceae bacterium]NIS86920.1 hypothetical protein [Nitrospinaceae bacterium]NIT83758.1 hypothetical protein [Nitrospinaceae bacterium]NIU45961.1 hypothetical protein [Nitrospinaceae bacterium]
IVDSYGIQTGNSFITPVRGEDYLVKRVSSGLQIMQKVMDPTPVAVQPVAVDTAQFKG